jgi:hypothetical protein
MSARRVFQIVLVASVVMLAVGIGPRFSGTARALPPAQAGVTIPYSGRLTNDVGQPVADGAYDFAFALYDAPEGGTPLWSETQTGVAVQGGAFTAALGSVSALPAGAQGRGLWLEVGVRGPAEAEFTALAPRQALGAVAPAAPESPSAGPACPHDHLGEDWVGAYSPGLRVESTSAQGGGIVGVGTFVGVEGSSNDGTGVKGESTNWLGVSGDSDNGVGVYGISINKYGVKGVSSYGTGVYGRGFAGIGVVGVGATVGVSGTVTGASGTGVYGSSANWIGVEGESTNGSGVYGDSGNGVGVMGDSDNGTGVSGHSGNWTGVYGGSTGGVGVRGYSGSSIGVEGVGATYGVSGTAASGAGVYGQGPNGVVGVSSRTGWAAVAGVNNAAGGVGVWGHTTAVTGTAVYGASSSGVAVRAEGWNVGGVANRKFYVDAAGNVYADGWYYGSGISTSCAPNCADYAETMDADETTPSYGPGDVLVVNQEGLISLSTTPYATNVVGVYSSRPAFLARAGDSDNQVPVALVGVVPVKVSAENGPVHPGDLLTTSSTPGHAMRAPGEPAPGTVIGKALGSLESGTGVIEMLVMLR